MTVLDENNPNSVVVDGSLLRTVSTCVQKTNDESKANVEIAFVTQKVYDINLNMARYDDRFQVIDVPLDANGDRVLRDEDYVALVATRDIYNGDELFLYTNVPNYDPMQTNNNINYTTWQQKQPINIPPRPYGDYDPREKYGQNTTVPDHIWHIRDENGVKRGAAHNKRFIENEGFNPIRKRFAIGGQRGRAGRVIPPPAVPPAPPPVVPLRAPAPGRGGRIIFGRGIPRGGLMRVGGGRVFVV